VTAAAQQAHDHTLSGGNLPTNQLIVWLTNPNSRGTGSGLSVAPAGGAQSTPAVPNPSVIARAHATAAAIAQSVASNTVVELDVAADLASPVPTGVPPDASQASLVRHFTVSKREPGASRQGEGWNQVTTPFVAMPAVLGFYGLSASAIDSGTDVISSRRDLRGVELGTGFKGNFRSVTVQVSALLPNYTSAPNTLITPRAMTANGYTAVPVGWLIQAKKPISSAQLADARHRAATAGITIESRTGPDRSLQHLRDYATLVGALVALGVLAMTVGLIRGETVGDLRTLAATGASSFTRRTLNATSAGALALLGGILGTTAAYLALIAWHWHDIAYLNRPPYANLAILILGLPAVAIIGAWLLGRTPKNLGRRPLG
jgi:putative ABC transport system permease protein